MGMAQSRGQFKSAPPCNCCALGAGDCLYASCCAPCYNGQTMPLLGAGDSCWLMCLLTVVCGPIGVCMVNQEVAQHHGIYQGALESCLCACCCPLCTMVQSKEQALIPKGHAGGNGTQMAEDRQPLQPDSAPSDFANGQND